MYIRSVESGYSTSEAVLANANAVSIRTLQKALSEQNSIELFTLHSKHESKSSMRECKTLVSLRKLFIAFVTEKESCGKVFNAAIACACATTSSSLSNWLIWFTLPAFTRLFTNWYTKQLLQENFMEQQEKQQNQVEMFKTN